MTPIHPHPTRDQPNQSQPALAPSLESLLHGANPSATLEIEPLFVIINGFKITQQDAIKDRI
jgi:hypothetical protein